MSQRKMHQSRGDRMQDLDRRVRGLANRHSLSDSNTRIARAQRLTGSSLDSARAETKTERERYRDLFKFAPDGYLVTDRYGKITQVNQAMSAMVRLESRFLLHKPFIRFVEGDDRDYVKRIYTQMRQDQAGEADAAVRLRPEDDGDVIIAHARAVAVRGVQNRLVSVRWILRDVTEQYRSAEQLARSREQLKALAVELGQAEQRERRRIAEGIHDTAVQSLALAKMVLSSAGSGIPNPAAAAVKEGTRLVGQAMEELRGLIFELSPPVLYELGFAPAVEWLVDQFNHRHGMSVEVREGLRREIPQDLGALLFQAIRELLMNILKHAKATRVVVTLRHGVRGIRIAVIDNGRGFSQPAEASAEGGFGLLNLRNRLEHLGGSLRIRSALKRGTCAKLMVPLEEPARKRDRAGRVE